VGVAWNFQASRSPYSNWKDGRIPCRHRLRLLCMHFHSCFVISPPVCLPKPCRPIVCKITQCQLAHLSEWCIDAIDFALNSTLRKIFSTRSQEVVEMCKHIFGCQTPSDVVANRKCKFLSKFIVSDNMICQVFKDVALNELTLLDSNSLY